MSGASDFSSGATVVTMGEAMRLLVAEPGLALRRATTFRSSIAGAESNVAIGLARMGFAVRWLSRVGADANGQSLLTQLRAENIDVSAVEVDPDRPTGILMRDSHPTRGITVQYLRSGSAACGLSGSLVRQRGLGGARLVHFSGITPMLSASAREATDVLLELAESGGATVSFDPNVRLKLGDPQLWRETIKPILNRADLIFAGEDELEMITGTSAENAVAALLAGGATSVLVKHGDKSAMVHTNDGQWHHHPLVQAVVDTVGAGDALVAGYLSAWLRQATPEAALFAGMVTAALVVGATTDIEGYPDQNELARAAEAFTAGGEHQVDR
jgi:2-dehydro-3-deoxygluconokinase